jgi:Mn2+/Fe2+ NRAMP family transporter
MSRYTIIALGVGLGLVIDWSPVSPMKALFWCSVLNGVVAVPVLVALMLAVSRKAIMRDFAASMLLRIFGWLTTAAMGVAVVAMVCLPG